MNGFTSVTIVGNLVHTPELKYPGGVTCCNFAVAVNTRKKISGEWRDEVHYFDVACFGKTAENVAKYMRKGSPVLCAGRLVQSRWVAEGGQKRQRVSIIGDEVNFLGPRKDGGVDQAAADKVREQFPNAQPVDEGDIPF